MLTSQVCLLFDNPKLEPVWKTGSLDERRATTTSRFECHASQFRLLETFALAVWPPPTALRGTCVEPISVGQDAKRQDASTRQDIPRV
jgi:hypothetical protein